MGVYMQERLQRSDLPDLRKFLDNLPMKPCPSKLPEEYCKICKRLNKNVAHYCKTRELPEKPKSEISEEDIPLGRLEPEKEEEDTKQPSEIHRRSPILDRPTYRDGDTSLEFVSSQRSIEEARKSLPRFIPVRKGPRTFRPIEDEMEMEFETFSHSRSSIFKEPSLLGQDDEDMMFTLVDDDAIEVLAVEVLSDDSFTSETVFSSDEGVVEVIDDHEDMPLMTFEEEVPAFEFMPSDEVEIVEAEIIEAEIVEDEPTFDTFTTQEQLKDTKQGISDLTDEITDMTESLDKEFAFRPYHPEAQDEIQAEEPQAPKRKIKKKMKKTRKKRVKRTRKKKPEELEPVGDHAFIPPAEEVGLEPVVEEPAIDTPIEEPEPMGEEPFPETPQEDAEPEVYEPENADLVQEHAEAPSELKFKIKDKIQAKEPQAPKRKLKKKKKMKMKLKKTKKRKLKDVEPIDDHAFIPTAEEGELEPTVEEPVYDTPIEEPEPISEEPFPETPQEETEPEPIVEEPFPDTPIEEPETIDEKTFPKPPWVESEPIAEESEPELVDEEPFQGEPEPELTDEVPESDVQYPPPEEEIGFTPEEPVESESQETPIEAPAEEPGEGGAADLYMCPSCGAFVSGSASVCIKCGYDFEAEEQRDQVEEPPYEPFDEPPFDSQPEGEIPIEEKPTGEKPKKKKKKKVKLKKKKKKMKLKKVKKK
jgi:hypothetical protein